MKKHNTITLLCLAALLLVGGMKSHAQLQTGFEQSVYLNGSLPLGTMSNVPDGMSDDPWLLGIEGVGTNATLGFGAGYRAAYHFDVGFGQMAPFVNVDFLWNQVRSDMREHNTILNNKSCNYFNIPLFLGLAYYYDGIDLFTPFAEAGLGYDLLFITPEGNKESGLYYKYNVKNVLAWQVGAGCYFGTHVSASLHYYGLGRHFVSYNMEKSQFGTEPLPDNTRRPISMGQLLLRVGFHF